MSEQSVVVVGAGGHAREVAWSLLRATGSSPSAFVGVVADWIPPATVESGFDSHWLGPIALLGQLRHRYIIAIGNSIDRRKVALELALLDNLLASVIDPTAVVGDRVIVGEGVYVAAGAVVTVDVELGDHVHLNVRSAVHHDSSIASYVTIGPGAVICGGVSIGEAVEIGAGVTVLPGVSIGNEAVVGAGAVVTSDVQASSTVVGVPARPLVARSPI